MSAPHTVIDPRRRVFRWTGSILTVVSAALTFVFGLSMSNTLILAVMIATALACASVASAYIWTLVAEDLAARRWGAAAAAAGFGVLFTGTDILTNFGSISWQRTANIQQATAQNVRYDDGRETIADLKSRRALFEKRLAELEGAKGWSGAKPASAYAGEIAAKDEAIAQEARRGGCGPICLRLKQERAELVANQATAAEHERVTAMLNATIEALNKTREKEATAEKAESGAYLQAASLASVFTLSLEPSEAALHWTDRGVGWLVALFLTFGAMGCNLHGWRSPRPVSPEIDRAAVTALAPSQDLPPRGDSIVMTVHDNPVVQQIIETIRQQRLAAA